MAGPTPTCSARRAPGQVRLIRTFLYLAEALALAACDRLDPIADHRGMRRWERPYTSDQTIVRWGLGVLAGAGAIVAAVIYLADVTSTLELFLIGDALALSMIYLVRRAMLGIYFSEYGLQSRSFFRTTTLPWASVAEIRSGTSTTGIPTGRTAIVIERTDGTTITTAIQRSDGFDPYIFANGTYLLVTPPDEYDEILAALRKRHNARRHQQPDRPRHTSTQQAPPKQTARPAPARRSPATSRDSQAHTHALIRQHERGALTDAEFTAEMAKLKEAR
ncbi:PH domain-containing protein [Phytohabitans kaempferiae]|uniref:PH domain-containing protein n=1 Tax=Phytohabitans kaempferiae TaxID=1620943 RepID=A0ABV6M760_9ACTN